MQIWSMDVNQIISIIKVYIHYAVFKNGTQELLAIAARPVQVTH